MINKLYINSGTSKTSELDNLETLMPKSGVRKVIDFLFGIIGGAKSDTCTLFMNKDCTQAKALLTMTDQPHNGESLSITPIVWATGATGPADVTLTVSTAITGATGLAIGTAALTGLSAGLAAIGSGALIAASINKQAALSGIVGATDNGDGTVLLTASRAGSKGNSMLLVEGMTHTSVTFQFGSTGIYVGDEGTEVEWDL